MRGPAGEIRAIESETAPGAAAAASIEVALAPRRPMVRKMQHRMITRYHSEAQSRGREPLRHLVIQPR